VLKCTIDSINNATWLFSYELIVSHKDKLSTKQDVFVERFLHFSSSCFAAKFAQFAKFILESTCNINTFI
jgi:hypothetical protein